MANDKAITMSPFVVRHAPEELHSEFAEAFTLLAHEEQLHHTPLGADPEFIYCMVRKMSL